MPNINIDLRIAVEDLLKKSTLYIRNFTMFVRDEFIVQTEEKKHNLQNHLYWLKEKIRLNQLPEVVKASTKWTIYYVNYGINVWNEINGKRPSIIYKDSAWTFGEDVIVIPLTSEKLDKSVDHFDVRILPDSMNWLKNPSYLKLRQIRSISKKRIESGVGKIVDRITQDQIEKNLLEMFGIDIKKSPNE